MTTVTIKFPKRADAVKCRNLLLDLAERESLLKASLLRSLIRDKASVFGLIEDDLTLNPKCEACGKDILPERLYHEDKHGVKVHATCMKPSSRPEMLKRSGRRK